MRTQLHSSWPLFWSQIFTQNRQMSHKIEGTSNFLLKQFNIALNLRLLLVSSTPSTTVKKQIESDGDINRLLILVYESKQILCAGRAHVDGKCKKCMFGTQEMALLPVTKHFHWGTCCSFTWHAPASNFVLTILSYCENWLEEAILIGAFAAQLISSLQKPHVSHSFIQLLFLGKLGNQSELT